MKYLITTIAALLALVSAADVSGQAGPPASDGHRILKHDVGTWKGECVMFMPGAEGESVPVNEVNRMIGDYWVISEFTMESPAFSFSGHGTFGYDEKSKKFTGSWIDSMNPNILHMSGTWDESNRTMTMDAKGLDADGKETVSRMTTTYSEDGNTRVFTKSDILPGSDDYVKTMEITYKRVPEQQSAAAKKE